MSSFSTEQTLTGIILADSYRSRFGPICLEKPKALIPLLNAPLLEYNLEFLATGGIKEIYIVATSFAEQIRCYVKEKTSFYNASDISLNIVEDKSFKSVGDVLRHFHRNELLRVDSAHNPFILIGADVVATFDLGKIIREHREQSKKSKTPMPAMTTIFKRAAYDHRSRSIEQDLFLCLSDHRASKNEILIYQSDRRMKECMLPFSQIKGHTKYNIHYDLIDCGVDICSTEILQMFVEYEIDDMRDDFLCKHVLSPECDVKAYAHILESDYAASVLDWPTYHGISLDLIQRWAFPLVPENNVLGNTAFKFFSKNIYREEENVKIGRSTKILEDTVVGAGTEIGENCVIDHCVIGRNVSIGRQTRLSHCHLWDGTQIGKYCNISYAVLANATVFHGTIMHPGCILSWDTAVGPDVEIPSHTYLTKAGECEEKIDKSLGIWSRGHRWANPEFNADDPNCWMFDPKICCTKPNLDDVNIVEKEIGQGFQTMSSHLGEDEFLLEMRSLLSNSEDHLDVAFVSIQSKMVIQAHNASYKEFSHAVFICFFESVMTDSETLNRENIILLKKHLKKYQTVLNQYPDDPQAQVAILEGLTEACCSKPIYRKFCAHVICELYELHIVCEQYIFENWYEGLNLKDPNQAYLHDKCIVFINWLRQESGSEDDSSSEEDS